MSVKIVRTLWTNQEDYIAEVEVQVLNRVFRMSGLVTLIPGNALLLRLCLHCYVSRVSECTMEAVEYKIK